MVVLLQRGWHENLAGLVASARCRLVISAPYISKAGARVVTDNLGEEFRGSGRLELLTDLSPAHVSDGSLEIGALIDLHRSAADSCLWHVPRIHA
ncbi:MAG: hypothetical protein K8E66_12990, partial [Phycisphaerales bacterium]|nr:hypothetical protein [Phycisphaerales bacterium]